MDSAQSEDQVIEYEYLPGTRDPWVGRLVIISLILVVLLLSGVVLALYNGLTTSQAPRTAVEAQLVILADAVSQYPTSGEAWGDYIRVLVAADQLTEAKRQMKIAYSKVKGLDTGPVASAELSLLWAQKDTAAVIDRADAMYQEQMEIRKKVVAEQAAKKLVSAPEDYMPEVLVDILTYSARAHAAEGDWSQAVTKLDKAIKIDPLAADLLVLRGEAHVKAGDADAARADFEQALKFSPDYAAAKAGLEGLAEGESQ